MGWFINIFFYGRPVPCIHIGYAFIIEYISSFFFPLISPTKLCFLKARVLTYLCSLNVDTYMFVSQFSWVAQSCLTLCNPMDAARQASLSITSSWSLLKLVSIELVMPSNHLILCHLLLLPSVFPSIRVFSNEWVLHIRWPKYWSFSISLSNEYLGLISFRIGWFDLLAVQGTFKSLLQHHSSKTSILWRSAFFMVQLSHPYMTTGKTIALTYLKISP